MSSLPLTHHEILVLVEPFTRRGRSVDLAASDRLERRLQFKAIDHPGTDADPLGLRETLQLDCYPSGNARLIRTLTRTDGLQATLESSGPDIGVLLERIGSVAPRSQFTAAARHGIARSHVLRAADGRASSAGAVQPVLSRGVVQLDDLTLVLTVPAVRGISAEITLTASPGAQLALPEDLLAVLGWSWARLIRTKEGWKTRLRLRGSPSRRTRLAEAALERVANHLALTLDEPPARFHERHLTARWWAAFRRAIPLLTPVSLVIAVLVSPRIDVGETPGLWLMLYHVPTVLIALSFTLQELPQFEIPPLPRRSRASAWREPAGAGTPVPASVVDLRSS